MQNNLYTCSKNTHPVTLVIINTGKEQIEKNQLSSGPISTKLTLEKANEQPKIVVRYYVRLVNAGPLISDSNHSVMYDVIFIK